MNKRSFDGKKLLQTRARPDRQAQQGLTERRPTPRAGVGRPDRDAAASRLRHGLVPQHPPARRHRRRAVRRRGALHRLSIHAVGGVGQAQRAAADRAARTEEAPADRRRQHRCRHRRQHAADQPRRADRGRASEPGDRQPVGRRRDGRPHRRPARRRRPLRCGADPRRRQRHDPDDRRRGAARCAVARAVPGPRPQPTTCRADAVRQRRQCAVLPVAVVGADDAALARAARDRAAGGCRQRRDLRQPVQGARRRPVRAGAAAPAWRPTGCIRAMPATRSGIASCRRSRACPAALR